MRPAPARAREPHVRLRESATVGVSVDRATVAEVAISLTLVLGLEVEALPDFSYLANPIHLTSQR